MTKNIDVANKKVSVSDLPKKKQLGFMSCILVVVGACIGAGIFFKNGTILNNVHTIVLSIVCWIISAIGVLAMALCLAEIVSGQKKTSNLGIAA
jgi:amino acid transporter